MYNTQEGNYKGETWARMIGNLFCIDTYKDWITLQNNVASPTQALLETQQSPKRLVFYDEKLSRNVCFFKCNLSRRSFCLRTVFRSPNRYRCGYATSLLIDSSHICVTHWSPTSCSLSRTVNSWETITKSFVVLMDSLTSLARCLASTH